jgi:uncharacterized protein YbjT (DUF2867 family)
MRVLVTGGTGLIGSAVLSRLSRAEHALVGAARDVTVARPRFPFCDWIVADYSRLTRAEDWAPVLGAADAVVNCVGVLQDGARDDVRLVQVEATVALFEACERAGIRRLVHISAIGAEAGAPTEFARTKAAAEDGLRRRRLEWVILRPGLVFGATAYGGTAMLRAVAAFPFTMPLVTPDASIQTADVDDLTETVAFSLRPDAPSRVTWDVAHPDIHSLGTIVGAMRTWLGLPPAQVLPVPAWIGKVVGRKADMIGWLGWRSPARTTALAQLAAGVVGDPAPWMEATGIRPAGLAETLGRHPAGVQEGWFARLYLLKPIAIAMLALFWIATGLIALGPGWARATSELEAAGFSHAATEALLAASALLDVALGLLLAWRKTARAALFGMLLVAFGYLVGGTVAAPLLWLDPLGPYLKIIPVLVATLFTLAILDER